MNRADEIVQEVLSRTHYWDAFEQGRWARATGVLRVNNPFRITPGYYHIVVSEWDRGWDTEDKRS